MEEIDAWEHSRAFLPYPARGLEQDQQNPTIVSLYELAMALGVSHMELVRPTEGQ